MRGGRGRGLAGTTNAFRHVNLLVSSLDWHQRGSHVVLVLVVVEVVMEYYTTEIRVETTERHGRESRQDCAQRVT